MSAPDPRLVAVLGGPALARLRARMRGRLERGEPLNGRITLAAPNPKERGAIERLFGRLSRGRDVGVDLDELAALLRGAELSDDLASAITALEGRLPNRRAQQAEVATRWQAVFDEARAAIGVASPWNGWLTDLRQTGLIRRFAGGDAETGAALLGSAVSVLGRLPAAALPLAELAAAATGDSHALDPGEPLTTIVLRALAARAGLSPPANSAERRAAWTSAGVLLDELSAPALVLNLPVASDNATGRALRLAAANGEPYRLSTRQLLREPPRFDPGLAADALIFVCENPTVVGAAADRLGPHAKPLVCTEGQPKTAVRLLLAALREANITIAYHGDFDWPGVSIANQVFVRYGATPWRFLAADYLTAPQGVPLEGAPVAPSWDARLGTAMRECGASVHEESVLDELVKDLNSCAPDPMAQRPPRAGA